MDPKTQLKQTLNLIQGMIRLIKRGFFPAGPSQYVQPALQFLNATEAQIVFNLKNWKEAADVQAEDGSVSSTGGDVPDDKESGEREVGSGETVPEG